MILLKYVPPKSLIDRKSTFDQVPWCIDVALSWRQPRRVDGPKASQCSIITYEINFCIDQAKTHQEDFD